jgi:hypothetical protein
MTKHIYLSKFDPFFLWFDTFHSLLDCEYTQTWCWWTFVKVKNDKHQGNDHQQRIKHEHQDDEQNKGS